MLPLSKKQKERVLFYVDAKKKKKNLSGTIQEQQVNPDLWLQ